MKSLQLGLMKYVLLVIVSICFLSTMGGQPDTLNLEYCYTEALKNYPLIIQKRLLENNTALKIKNYNTTYFPQISANGQMTYQSEVTTIPKILPFMTPIVMNKDQYKVTLDVNQMIWDGGTTESQKLIEESTLNADLKSVDVELSKIKERINIIFFNILLARQNENIIKNISDNLKEKLRTVEVSIKNGVLLQSNAEVLQAEILKTEQQYIEISAMKLSAIQMLKEYMNQNIPDDVVLIKPEINTGILSYDNKRQEMELFDLQIKKIDISKKLINSKITPKMYAFGQTGYGRPGLNMLSNNFDFYYYLGAKLSWNFSALYQMKRDIEIADIQKDIIKAQKETFEKNLKISTQKEISDISKYSSLIEKDIEIIALREKVTKSASTQLESGVITASDYINELNAEKQARLNKELHEMQLILSKINYLYALGKL